jgi:purine-cytosine permease-like protein
MLFGIILIAVQIAFDISAYANLRTPIRFDAPLMGIVMGLCFALIFALLIRLMLSFRLPPSLD